VTVGRYRIAEFLEPPGDRATATLHVGVGPTTGAGRGVRIEVCPVGVPNQRRDQPDERASAARRVTPTAPSAGSDSTATP